MHNPNNVKLKKDFILESLQDTNTLSRILQSGIFSALQKHHLTGNPVCELQDDQVVWVAAKDIKATWII